MAPPSWYSRWDGSQRLDDLDADQLLEAMSDDILSDGDPLPLMPRPITDPVGVEVGRDRQDASGVFHTCKRLRPISGWRGPTRGTPCGGKSRGLIRLHGAAVATAR